MLIWGNGPIIPAYPYLAVRRSTRRYGNNRALRGWFTIRVPRRAISSVLEAQALIERMVAEGRAPILDELANMLFVSRSHLCSAFSRETGQGIGHYARARRMERSKTMFVGCCSVAQVATRLGWSAVQRFLKHSNSQRAFLPLNGAIQIRNSKGCEAVQSCRPAPCLAVSPS